MLSRVASSFVRLSRQQTRQAFAFALSRSIVSSNPWRQYEMAPKDPIFSLNEEFAKDDFPKKQIVGVGAYRDDCGKPYVLPCVREAEKKLMDQNLDMEYSGIVRTVCTFIGSATLD